VLQSVGLLIPSVFFETAISNYAPNSSSKRGSNFQTPLPVGNNEAKQPVINSKLPVKKSSPTSANLGVNDHD